MTPEALGLIVVGAFTLIGTVYQALSARRTNTATVDVRIFKLLQEDVVLMRTELTAMRHDLATARDETDSERRLRRMVEARLTDLERALDRVIRAMDVAGIPVPEEARSLLSERTP